MFPEEEIKTLVEYTVTKDNITRLLKKRFRKEGEYNGEWVMIKEVPVGLVH